MKITLRGVLGLLRTVLSFLPGGDRQASPVAVRRCRTWAASSPYQAAAPAGLVPIVATMIDVNLLPAHVGEELRPLLGTVLGEAAEGNVVVLVLTGQQADDVRRLVSPA